MQWSCRRFSLLFENMEKFVLEKVVKELKFVKVIVTVMVLAVKLTIHRSFQQSHTLLRRSMIADWLLF